MTNDPIGKMFVRARTALGLSQAEVGRRVGVSTRLVAELERGQRPNVSLATALRLLSEVGVKIELTDSTAVHVTLGDERKRAAARAAFRRATWTGAQVRLSDVTSDDPAAPYAADRVTAVGVVSQQAFAVARGKRSGRRKIPARKSAPRPR